LYTTNNQPLGCSSVILREEFNSAIAQPTEFNATPGGGGRTGYASKCAISPFLSEKWNEHKQKEFYGDEKRPKIPQLWPLFFTITETSI
jgi:hypothetical protein